MKARDLVISINCIICGRPFRVIVNSDDYYEYKNRTQTSCIKDTEKLFPYLTEQEIDLIEMNICHHCV